MPGQRRVLCAAGRTGVTVARQGSLFEALTRQALDQERALERLNGFHHMLGRADRISFTMSRYEPWARQSCVRRPMDGEERKPSARHPNPARPVRFCSTCYWAMLSSARLIADRKTLWRYVCSSSSRP
jgi:hypothetical protein